MDKLLYEIIAKEADNIAGRIEDVSLTGDNELVVCDIEGCVYKLTIELVADKNFDE